MITALLRSFRFMRRYRLSAAVAVLAVLAATAADLASPQVLRHLIDAGIARGDFGVIARGAAALVALAVAGGVAQFLHGFLSAKASHGAAFEMRDAIFSKLQELSFSYHDRAETGQLITRVTSDVDLVREVTGAGVVQFVSAVLMLAGAIVLLLAMNPALAAVALLTVPATVFVLVFFVRGLGPRFREVQAKLGRLNSVLQENIAGIRVVKSFAREPYERERYGAVNEDLLREGLTVRRMVSNSFPLLFFVGSLGTAAVTWAGAAQVVRGTLTIGELVAFTAYIALLLQPLYILGFSAQSIARSGASAQRVFEVLDASSEVAEKPDAVEPGEIAGRTEFRDVSFRYPGDDHDTLSGVSFTVEPDTVVAIVGATGSGKSSLVNLIPRFYDVTGGAVLIDGRDVRGLKLDALRRGIGVVMQDSVLFSGTVRDNIAYGRADATDGQVRAAARAAQAHDFIEKLPEGYDSRVGERGVKLSGGQRQRVAIARALLIDPRVLIMDDSTSSVDAVTEKALRGALERLMRGRTTFVIAQRLSTVREADRILLVEDGRIIASGTHEELLERDCTYAAIAASQLLGDADA